MKKHHSFKTQALLYFKLRQYAFRTQKKWQTRVIVEKLRKGIPYLKNYKDAPIGNKNNKTHTGNWWKNNDDESNNDVLTFLMKSN